MLNTGIPALLATLSHDLLLVCDEQHTIQEANNLALEFLDRDIPGKSLLDLLHPMSHTKGTMFLEHMDTVGAGEISNTWELFFNVTGQEPMLLNVRAAHCDEGGWLIAGTCDSPQLTSLYREVLVINTQLTNLIRQLSKEQANPHHWNEHMFQT